MDIEKLMMAKAIMDRNTQMDKGVTQKPDRHSLSEMQMDDFEVPQAKYNIPQEFLAENPRSSTHNPMMGGMPMSEMSAPAPKPYMNKPYPQASVDAIKNSKLPDAIKKLMIEHPIEKPSSSGGGITLTDELVEKASRLMGTKRPTLNEGTQPQTQVDPSGLRKMMKEVVKEVLKENGMLTESSEKSNDSFKFQVGKHIFEGKLTRVKKMS